MKLRKVLALAMAAVLVFVSLGSASNLVKADSKIDTSDKKTTITFWHAMNGVSEEALQTLVKKFEEQNPNITVKLQNQGQYMDLRSKINSTMSTPKDLPTITQAYPGWLYQMAEDDQLVNLKPYMENKKIGWKDQEPIREDLLKGAQINGKQYGIPFNKSTEVLYYNKEILDKYHVKVPTNMEEFAKAAKTIYEKSNKEVVGGGFDVLSTYYLLGMKGKGHNFNKELNFESKDSKSVINYYAKGVKEGYFRIPGSDKYLSGPFVNGKLAMYVGSVSGEGILRKDIKFDYGVAPRPSKYNIQQGTDLYMFASASKAQRTAAFKLMKFLASPESQLYWSKQTGYIPITKSTLESKEYLESGSKVAPQVKETTKHLISVPVTKNADAAFNELNVVMENILSNTKKNINKLIEQGAAQLQDAWNQ